MVPIVVLLGLTLLVGGTVGVAGLLGYGPKPKVGVTTEYHESFGVPLAPDQPARPPQAP